MSFKISCVTMPYYHVTVTAWSKQPLDSGYGISQMKAGCLLVVCLCAAFICIWIETEDVLLLSFEDFIA